MPGIYREQLFFSIKEKPSITWIWTQDHLLKNLTMVHSNIWAISPFHFNHSITIFKLKKINSLHFFRAMAPSRSEETSLVHRITSRTHLGDGASNYATRNPSPVSSPSMQRKMTSRRVKSAANLNEKSNNNHLLYEHDLENRVKGHSC